MERKVPINLTNVTIGVAAYNASLFIEEALESIYNQTHEALHLIVSDDCSKDKTVSVVEQWLKQDRVVKRFQSIQLLTVPKNTGVSANCNRIIHASKTDWIKFHAGDDILLPNCITDNLEFVDKNPQAQIIFSQVVVYQDTFEQANLIRTTPDVFPSNLFDPNLDAQKQFKILLQNDRIHYTPSYFFNKNALAKVGNYDETSRLVEDYPMWLKLTQANIKLNYFHLPTVGYRIHGNATNNTGAVLFKPSVFNSFEVRQKYAHPHLPWSKVKQEKWVYQVSKIFSRFKIMRPTPLNKILYRFFTLYANPFFWINAIKKSAK